MSSSSKLCLARRPPTAGSLHFGGHRLYWRSGINRRHASISLSTQYEDIIVELNTDANTGFVFGAPPALDAAMRDICKALNVPRAVPHDLRRSHGTTITGLGFGREAMNRVQNHREGGIADVYDRHQYSEENIRIMEAVAARLLALAEGTDAPTNVVSLRT